MITDATIEVTNRRVSIRKRSAWMAVSAGLLGHKGRSSQTRRSGLVRALYLNTRKPTYIGGECPLWVDAVEKGKNEPIEIFAFAPVETGFSQSEGSQ